ncbi:MAG: glycosyltransferase [Anaerolineae bacterium]|nr:glycosyltransferase [Anaerolineae bacterium]
MHNILMLTPYLPYPPVSGGRSRTFNLIKRLVRDYRITLLCFARPEERAFDLTPLQELCEVVVIDRASSPGALRAAVLSATSIRPITMRLYTSPAFRDALRRLMRVRLFDLVHVESFYMMQNVPRDLPIPVLLSEPAVEYVAWWRHAKVAQPVFQRPALALEALKMRIFEPRAWRRATIVGAMSEIDAAEIRQAAPGVPTFPTPNGVDVDYFKPGSNPRDAASALFMGDYKYFPNTDAVMYFVREIMPLIRAQKPEFRLTLLGKDPTPEMRELAAKPNSGITITGLVDDTRPYLTAATLFVCPLRSGSGTRFKILEAMACGCPVVSTALGAEGLGAMDGRHLLLADTPRAFANAALKLIDQPDDASRLSRFGRQWVVERHSWGRSAAFLADAYANLIGSSDLTVPSPLNRRLRRR